MRRQLTMQDLLRAFLILGFGHRYLIQKLNSSVFEEMCSNFEALKLEAKKKWKEKAFELHPDRNDGDSIKFKELSTAFELVNKVKLQPTPVVQRIIFRQAYHSPAYGNGGFAYTSTTTSGTSTGW